MKINKMLQALATLGIHDEAISKKAGLSGATISRLRRERVENCKIFTAEAIRKIYEQETNTTISNYS
jgi:DNA-binding Xre family transcriptional regulator